MNIYEYTLIVIVVMQCIITTSSVISTYVLLKYSVKVDKLTAKIGNDEYKPGEFDFNNHEYTPKECIIK